MPEQILATIIATSLDNITITKAELLQEGIFFSHRFICQRRFSNEKAGNRKN